MLESGKTYSHPKNRENIYILAKLPQDQKSPNYVDFEVLHVTPETGSTLSGEISIHEDELKLYVEVSNV